MVFKRKKHSTKLTTIAYQDKKQHFLEKSEFYLLFRLLFYIFAFPILLLLVIFGIRKARVLKRPFAAIKDFFISARYTSILAIILVITYFIGMYLYSNYPSLFETYFTNKPSDLFSKNFFTVFTSIFIHASILHLLSNLFALLAFGRIVEKELNSKMLLIFFVSGILANVLRDMFALDNLPAVGASGGIAGLIGASLITAPFKFSIFLPLPLPSMIISFLWFFSEYLALNANDSVAHDVHLFGFFTGFAMAFSTVDDALSKFILGVVGNIAYILFFSYLYYTFFH